MQPILITGGSGRLGSALRKVLPDAITPTHSEMDILLPAVCRRWIYEIQPRAIVHCAGYVNALLAETHKKECMLANVTGTYNVLYAHIGIRFIYMSSDYVFDGTEGDYSEDSIPNPVNFYGLTKYAGEVVTLTRPDTLVVRAPFRYGPPWPYPRAFADQWTSARFVDEVAADIAKVADTRLTGIIHIGGPPRSTYEMAKSVSPSVTPMVRSDIIGVNLPRDVSLDSTLWDSLSRQ